MSGQHARLSASSAHRWMKCPGSVNASVGKESTSVYAAAGTYAHEIAAKCLTTIDTLPSDWIGQTVKIDGFEVECAQEMVDAVQVYLDTVRLDKGDYCAVEMPLLEALQTVDPDLGGTADFIAYRRRDKHLRVLDFKYGSGTYVEPESNKQQLIYALGAMLAIGKPVQTVELVIVQPRFEGAAPVRTWKFDAVDILNFAADVKDAARDTRLVNPALHAGDQCQFCPAARDCPELEKHHHALVVADFTKLPYDPAKLAAALVSIPLVKARIKAIEEFAYGEANNGRSIPGFKLVDKRATRRWKSEADIIEWAQTQGIEPYAKREVLSPAQLEKEIAKTAPKGQKKGAGAALEPFVEKVSSGTALVPESDERPAVSKMITANDFAALGGPASTENQSPALNLFE